MSEHLRHHLTFSPAEFDAQYNLRARRPDFETAILPAWTAASVAARARLGGRLDLRYGAGARQLLDVFAPAGPGAPTLVYLHGGYWQGGDKSLYSFLAPAFAEAGANLVVVGYDLCPAVTITRICEEAREAMAFLWRNAPALDLGRERIVVMGHSAGGHLAQMMMATDWPGFGEDLPEEMIAAAVPVSPVSYLEPVRLTAALNAALRMDAAEAEAQSPMTRHPPATDAPQLVVVGGAETPEFLRQARMYVETYRTPWRAIELHVVPGVDHFDLLDVLADPASAAFARVRGLVLGASAPWA